MHQDTKIELQVPMTILSQDLKSTMDQNTLLQKESLRIRIQHRKFTNVIDKREETQEESEWNFLQMYRKCGLPLDPLCITRAYRIGVSTHRRPNRAMIVFFQNKYK